MKMFDQGDWLTLGVVSTLVSAGAVAAAVNGRWSWPVGSRSMVFTADYLSGSKPARRKALRKAVDHHGYGTVLQSMIHLQGTVPLKHRKALAEDYRFVVSTFGRGKKKGSCARLGRHVCSNGRCGQLL